MNRTLLGFTIATLALSSILQAQQGAAALTPGRRVRIHQQGGQPLVGAFVTADSTTLSIVTAPKDTVHLRQSAVTGVDLSLGTKSHAGKGALIGLGAGMLVGAIAGAASSCSVDAEVPPAACAVAGALVFGALGTGVGALFGAMTQTEQWQPTAWPTLGFRPGGLDGTQLALGLHLQF